MWLAAVWVWIGVNWDGGTRHTARKKFSWVAGTIRANRPFFGGAVVIQPWVHLRFFDTYVGTARKAGAWKSQQALSDKHKSAIWAPLSSHVFSSSVVSLCISCKHHHSEFRIIQESFFSGKQFRNWSFWIESECIPQVLDEDSRKKKTCPALTSRHSWQRCRRWSQICPGLTLSEVYVYECFQ